MEYTFQVYIASSETDEEAKAKLDIINAALRESLKNFDINANGPAFNVIKIEGVTVHENPFPLWFRDAAKASSGRVSDFIRRVFGHPPRAPIELELDPVNWSYEAKCTRAESDVMGAWLLRLISWADKKFQDEKSKSVLRRLRCYTWAAMQDVPNLEDVA